MMLSFCSVLFYHNDILDEVLDLSESVSEGFPTYSFSLFLATCQE